MGNLLTIAPVALMTLFMVACKREAIVYKVIEKQIAGLTSNDEYTNNKEGITVVTVGTASPVPGERAQTGTAVFVNDHFFMFDAGAGVVQKIETFGLPWKKLDGIFITHYHSDHVMDLPNMISRSWQRGRVIDLNVYGPQGLSVLMASVDDFLAVDKVYRVAHHGHDIMDTTYADGIVNEFNLTEGAHQLIYDQDGIKITAFDVTHEPIEPAVGYKIEYNGKKVIISGDTKKNALLTEMAQNADLLVHEVMIMEFQQMLSEASEEAGMDRNAHILTDIQDYHTSPAEVAEIAQTANVKKLVLNHLAPVPSNRILKKMYLDDMKAYKGPIHLADDGDIYVVE